MTFFPFQAPAQNAQLAMLAAVFVGFGFGFVLERAGFGNARKLLGQFYGNEMVMLKVMFTAIVTAVLGTVVLAGVGLLDLRALADRVLVLQNGTLERAISPEALASMVAPEVRLTLWISEGERARAVARLRREGLAAHINGRGTVIVQCKTQDKMHPLNVLRDEGISVSNLEVEGAVSWN